MIRAFILILSVLIAISSCKKDETEVYKSNSDLAYFNSSKGTFIIYDVLDITYDDFTNTIDTARYQIREFNESIFTDNTGTPGVRIERSIRNDHQSDWKYLNTWYSVIGKQSIERVEDNKRFIKLSFPVTTDAVWNSNSLNMDNAINVFYGLIRKRYQMGTFKFDNVISVESATIANKLRERAFREIYAKNIGLVYKYYVNIEKNGELSKGKRITYVLNTYGQ